MKLKHLILFLAVVVAACSTRHPVETRLIASPNRQLQAVDSLLWQQPDSALMVLVDFAASPQADSLSAFDGHYFQMLLSELLYKNYQPQLNREDLLKALDYFDSIVGTDETDARKADTRGVSLRERNAFLDARAHYINGAGLYEQGSVVEACAEYLRALEVIEKHFKEQDLTGGKAVFMENAYGRLFELFSAQFMMDPAIACGEKALAYCDNELALTQYIPVLYYHLGKQYDKKGERKMAKTYYGRAVEGLSDINNPVYRDVVSSKALCDFQEGFGANASLDAIRKVLPYANSEKEVLTRFMTMGVIFTIEQSFDSSIYYLEPVFEDQHNVSLQICAAEYLLVDYDNLGDKAKSEKCMRFLANHKKSEGESKALTSQLENMFKTYTEQKQAKEAEKEREKSIRKIIGIIVPAALLVALAIIILVKQRSRKLLKQQQEKSDRVLGETEQAHEEELRRLQAETQQRLEETERKHRQKVEEMVKRHEDELRIQRDQSGKEMEQTRQRHEAELEAERWRQEFLKEPICRRINELLHGKRITTRDTSFKHDDITLEEEDFKQLSEAVERHFEGFDAFLLSRCPSLKHGDLALCHLHLMGLGEGEIAALKSRTYSGIKKQDESIKEKLSLEESVSEYVLRIAEKLVNPSEDIFNGSITNETLSFSQKSSQKNSQKIVELIRKRPGITTSEMAETAGVSRRTIVNITNKLREEGAIRRVGPDKGGHWEVIE